MGPAEVADTNELIEAFKELPQDVWVVGTTHPNNVWMAEAILDTEEEAVAVCRENEFVAKMPFGERLPDNVRNLECIYWPHRETKEEGMAKLEVLKKEPIVAEPTGCSGCTPAIIEGKLVHEPGCPWLNAPVGGGLGIINAFPPVKDKLPLPEMKPPKEEPEPPKGYGELKVGMEGMLNGVPVRVRKITKKDIIMRPLNRVIRDKDGMMVSFEEGKKSV